MIEAVVFIFILLGLMFITVGLLSGKVSASYLMVFAFVIIYLRSELAYMLEKSPHKESMEMLTNIAVLACVVMFVGALTYNLFASAVKKKKADDKDIRENT